NIGLFCGEPSRGLVVVDFDDCHFPPRGMSLPLTPTVKTGRDTPGGYHLYYRTHQPVAHRSYSWGEVRGWTRGVPLQGVARPSRHPETGCVYGWQLPIGEAPFADFSMVDLGELGARRDVLTTTEPPSPGSPLSPTKDVLLRRCTTAVEPRGQWLRGFDRDE